MAVDLVLRISNHHRMLNNDEERKNSLGERSLLVICLVTESVRVCVKQMARHTNGCTMRGGNGGSHVGARLLIGYPCSI